MCYVYILVVILYVTNRLVSKHFNKQKLNSIEYVQYKIEIIYCSAVCMYESGRGF